MANYDGKNNGGYPSKPGVGGLYPDGQADSGYGRMEPLLEPAQLKNRFMKGIPLISKIKNPLTGEYDRWTDTDLEEEIRRAVLVLEQEASLDILPTQHVEKQDFIRQDYESFGYMKTRHKPVVSIEEMAIVPANNLQVYEVPLDWIETAYLGVSGQINIVPLNVAVQNGGFIPSQSAGGAVFLSILAQNNIIPAYWRLVYTTGFTNGIVPVAVNEWIGRQAAAQILSQLLTTYVNATSHSLGMDGMSQSVGAPVIKALEERIEKLEQERDKLTRKFRRMFGQGIATTAV